MYIAESYLNFFYNLNTSSGRLPHTTEALLAVFYLKLFGFFSALTHRQDKSKADYPNIANQKSPKRGTTLDITLHYADTRTSIQILL